MKKGWVIGIVIAVLVIAVIVYFSFSGNYSHSTNMPSNTPSNTPSAPQSGNAITIQNFAFSPATINVKVGDTVTWTNRDSAPHQIASDSGSELSSSTLSNGATYSHTFTSAGTYAYHCAIHTSMKGSVVVS